MSEFKEIATKLKIRRQYLGYKQADVAELTGISLRSIRAIENGEGSTSIASWYKILEVLGMEMKIEFKQLSDAAGQGSIQ